MYNEPLYNQLNLRNDLRQLWEQHVMWTRSFIISTAENLGDLNDVTQRLLQNPDDMSKIFVTFYGKNNADKLKQLLADHLQIAANLVNSAKMGNTKDVDMYRTQWYNNADQIAIFLSELNPNWSVEKWREFLFNHLEMTEDEARNRFNGNYKQDIQIYNNIENEALKMADYMADGILLQFPA